MTTRSAVGSTELADVNRCDRLVGLKHVDRLTLIASPRGRTIGTLLHVWLRYWYAQFLASGPPPWFYKRSAEEELARVGNGVNPDYHQTARVMFAMYLHQFQLVDQSWRILSVEKAYKITVRTILDAIAGEHGLLTDTARRALEILSLDDFVSIRTDLVTADPTYQYVMDYKSQLGMGKGLPQWSDTNRYGLSWQAYMYLWVTRHLLDESTGRQLFPNLKSFVIQRIQNTEPYHADRNELSITPEVYAEIPSLILRQLAQRKVLLNRIKSGEYIEGSYWACWGEYGRCDFFDLCRASNQRKIEMLKDPMIFRFERDDETNELDAVA